MLAAGIKALDEGTDELNCAGDVWETNPSTDGSYKKKFKWW